MLTVLLAAVMSSFLHMEVYARHNNRQSRAYNGGPLKQSRQISAVTTHTDKEKAIFKRTANADTVLCDLRAVQTDLHEQIALARDSGSQMLKYTLHFWDKDDYTYNPLTRNMSRHFKADQWRAVFSQHGRTLLSLAFNYDTLSLFMLTFGVQNLRVDLVDSPGGCFGKFTEDDRIDKIRQLVMTDFQVNGDTNSYDGEDEEVCNQVIVDKDGVADFTFECCKFSESNSGVSCSDEIKHSYIEALYTLIATIKIAFLLFGPVLLQRWVYSEPGQLNKTAYVIKLCDSLRKTLLVKKVAVNDTRQSGPQKEMKQFSKFRKLVKAIPSDEVVPVKFDKIYIMVNHKKLISEKRVPVGLFKFLYRNIIRCGLQRYEPFLSCCKQSIFGSWSPRFLWLPLQKESDCNRSCRKHLSWGHVSRLLGGILLVALIPLPYYIRIILFYNFEEDEIEKRIQAADIMDLDISYDNNLFQYLTPTHGLIIALYITYATTIVLLAAFRVCDSEKFDDVLMGALRDFKAIKCTECIRLILAHLLLPLEKFGLCGLLIGLVYWPIALPVCMLVTVCYCIPTLYLIGRLCLQKRPTFLATKPWPSHRRKLKNKLSADMLSEGTSSFETAMLLENISPRDQDKPTYRKNTTKKRFSCNTQKWISHLVALFVGLLFVLCMLCMLLMFAECFGFAVEIFVLTLMGTIVNASSAARYAMLAFWIIMYCSTCFNNAYMKYAKLNHKLFDYIKAKMNSDVQAVTLYREDKQVNTAFKYFTMRDLQELRQQNVEIEMDSDTESVSTPQTLKSRSRLSTEQSHIDTIEYVKEKLFWKMNCLIFFVDTKDKPRIPKELFRQVCEIKAPGCPGPIHKSLMKATKELMYMVVFFIFVFLVILSFGDFYEISTTNQMLLTLSSGFVPFVVRFVLSPKVEDLTLNTYSFNGKVHQIIKNFSQMWPVYDLSFKCSNLDSGEGVGLSNPGGTTIDSTPSNIPRDRPDVFDPSHVDLLITVRDDQYDDVTEHQNLRSEPDSLGSRGSLNSGFATRHSPEDPPPRQHCTTNNPTNASVNLTDVVPEYPRSRSQRLLSKPPVTTTSSDLVIDLSKGDVQVHPDQSQYVDSADNSMAMRPLNSATGGATGGKYPPGKRQDSESEV